jgi:hypothetical protein
MTFAPAPRPMSCTTESASRSSLLDAFLATDYRVECDGHAHVLRIGQRHPEFDRAIGDRPWVSITACNPGAQFRSEVANQRANELLAQSAQAAGLAFWPALHQATDGSGMDEAALLVLAAEPEWIHHQARHFGQLGVVCGQPGGVAELWLYQDLAGQETCQAARRIHHEHAA